MFHSLETPAGFLEVREVPAALLPAGKWWQMVPPSLSGGRLLVLTSDFERFKREIEAGEEADSAKPSPPSSPTG